MASCLLLFCIVSLYSGKPTAAEPDVHHIDFRVGKIVSAKKHPDADTLFVEESKFFFLFFSLCAWCSEILVKVLTLSALRGSPLTGKIVWH